MAKSVEAMLARRPVDRAAVDGHKRRMLDEESRLAMLLQLLEARGQGLLVAVGAKTIWVRLGIWNQDAAIYGESKGVTVVMDRSITVEHARFHGGLHLLGFDTGADHVADDRAIADRSG